ncbi:hypothetical protein CMUS01_14715 [Colletotrichum musicola]|uniref:Uncharacterized protein n=1 Tax=Colletotrichum musicola TaxID=2175873 RepID=A0A8H6J222_9PEZI|nr:hypothetical protein CMUS01_14715 [Colletotrichum musicola]
MIKRPSEPSAGTPAGPNEQGLMSLPGPSVSTITSLRPEFDTLYRLKEQLEANQHTWKAAYSSLGMRLAANVDEYKVFSHGLQARQSQLISEAYDKPLAEQLLGRSERYMFPPLDRLIFSRADSVITCKPNEPEPTESRHDESDPQDVIRYADQATQFPDVTPQHTVYVRYNIRLRFQSTSSPKPQDILKTNQITTTKATSAKCSAQGYSDYSHG